MKNLTLKYLILIVLPFTVFSCGSLFVTGGGNEKNDNGGSNVSITSLMETTPIMAVLLKQERRISTKPTFTLE